MSDGTFTDAVLVGADGAVSSAKVADHALRAEPSACSPPSASCWRAAGVEPTDVERFAHGMTVATNALLEGRAARTALIATAGFTDVIELGRQARPHLYRLCEAAPRAAGRAGAALRRRRALHARGTAACPSTGPLPGSSPGRSPGACPEAVAVVAAALLRPSRARAAARRAAARAPAPSGPRLALPRARRARSASTSAPPPPSSTPPSRPLAGLLSAPASPASRARSDCPSRSHAVLRRSDLAPARPPTRR